jgi:hypothetical protein
VLFDKLIVPQLLKLFPTCFDLRNFIIVLRLVTTLNQFNPAFLPNANCYSTF